MQLEGVVSWNAFRQAVTGYHKIAGRKRDVLTLIDFSRPSTEQRLFVFDMGRRKLLFPRSLRMAKTAVTSMLPHSPTNTVLTKAPWAST